MLSAVWMSAQGEGAKISTGIRAVAGRGGQTGVVFNLSRLPAAQCTPRETTASVCEESPEVSHLSWFSYALRSLRNDDGVNGSAAGVVSCRRLKGLRPGKASGQIHAP